MDTVLLWSKILSRKNGVRVSTKLISRLEKKALIKNSLSYSKEIVKERLKESYQKYYKLRKETVYLRESWLRDLVAIKVQSSDSNQDTIIFNLI